MMDRLEFLKFLSFGLFAGTAISLKSFAKELTELPQTDTKMPVVFIGHGSPMNAIEDNAFTRSLSQLGASLPVPKAILCVSAHWLTNGTYVMGAEKPQMIYDMYGFPKELYEVKYPAPGAPAAAKTVQETIKSTHVKWDTEWGYDHGNWAVMRRIFPKADIPLFQLSIDIGKPASYHYSLSRELASLRRKGVLIIGSGNITHNLRIVDFSSIDAKPMDWALEFDTKVKDLILKNEHGSLLNYEAMGTAAKTAVPTPDHYYPLMYTLGLQEKDDLITFPFEGFQYGSVSMRCVKIS